jgi:hypothetical protein
MMTSCAFVPDYGTVARILPLYSRPSSITPLKLSSAWPPGDISTESLQSLQTPIFVIAFLIGSKYYSRTDWCAWWLLASVPPLWTPFQFLRLRAHSDDVRTPAIN